MPKRFSSSFQRRVLPRVRRVSGSFRASDERRLQGCLVRFRPMRMTIVPAMLGAVSIAIGHGAGGEARQPLGPGWQAVFDLRSSRPRISRPWFARACPARGRSSTRITGMSCLPLLP